MPFVSREAIFQKLYELLCSVTPPASVCGEDDLRMWNLSSRDLQPWDQVPSANQPALFMVQTPQRSSQDYDGLGKWRLGATVWIYYKTVGVSDPDQPRDKTINELIDAFDSALGPVVGQRQTLSGLVYHTFIDGAVVFDNGLLDSQAVLLIPITVMVGAFGI